MATQTHTAAHADWWITGFQQLNGCQLEQVKLQPLCAAVLLNCHTCWLVQYSLAWWLISACGQPPDGPQKGGERLARGSIPRRVDVCGRCCWLVLLPAALDVLSQGLDLRVFAKRVRVFAHPLHKPSSPINDVALTSRKE